MEATGKRFLATNEILILGRVPDDERHAGRRGSRCASWLRPRLRRRVMFVVQREVLDEPRRVRGVLHRRRRRAGRGMDRGSDAGCHRRADGVVHAQQPRRRRRHEDPGGAERSDPGSPVWTQKQAILFLARRRNRVLAAKS